MKPVAPSAIPIIPNVSIVDSSIRPCLTSVSIFIFLSVFTVCRSGLQWISQQFSHAPPTHVETAIASFQFPIGGGRCDNRTR